ncbi:hypothetical protein ONZ45_g7791 [Pleurotus djamor]|nr:hypothetical protein ONZ45_g7791 [Pleurotus djamor]
MASADVWTDFETTRTSVRYNTVDKLKQIINGLNEQCHAHLSKSGKKQELIDRIWGLFDSWRAGNTQDRWLKAKNVLHQLRENGGYSSARYSPAAPITPHHSLPVPTANGYRAVLNPNSASSSTGSTAHYDPYAPPRKPGAPASTSSSMPKGLQFKTSPFFRVEHAVSPVYECPESTGASDRKTGKLNFLLTGEDAAKLNLPDYQVRLYCTSSMFYTPQPAAFRTPTATELAPIEFPQTCEVRVNGVLLTANLKGLKKKPGTAPPPDIGSLLRRGNIQNNIEMIYVNGQQPVQPKKYYLVAMLIQATTVDQLVDRLKKGKFRSAEDIRQQMVSNNLEDDDIVAGSQKLSLKCPLSFMRINTPCRSTQCIHPQCFDALSWFSVMEQTTTWLCPVCEKVLKPDDLYLDGYFDEILRSCPDDIEDILVETDGAWHTSDDMHASADWRRLHPPKVMSPPPKPVAPVKPEPTDGLAMPPPEEIVVLDSDDEEEGQVKRQLSPSFASSSSLAPSVPASDDVIDLTADSDEDRPRPSLPSLGHKRKIMDTPTSPTEEIWKKGRIERDLPGGYPTHRHSSAAFDKTPSSPLELPRRSSGSYQQYPPPRWNEARQTYDYDGQFLRVPGGIPKNR